MKTLEIAMEHFERQHILYSLRWCHLDQSQAARSLGLGRRAFIGSWMR
jgi:DNA-binding NtrC family response regulator